jgi:hypothetical protein
MDLHRRRSVLVRMTADDRILILFAESIAFSSLPNVWMPDLTLWTSEPSLGLGHVCLYDHRGSRRESLALWPPGISSARPPV